MHHMRTASADWRLFFTTELRSWLNSYLLELKHTCILRGIYSAPPTDWHALTRALCNAFHKWLLPLAWCCMLLSCYKTRTLAELFNCSWKQTEHAFKTEFQLYASGYVYLKVTQFPAIANSNPRPSKIIFSRYILYIIIINYFSSIINLCSTTN